MSQAESWQCGVLAATVASLGDKRELYDHSSVQLVAGRGLRSAVLFLLETLTCDSERDRVFTASRRCREKHECRKQWFARKRNT